MRRPPCQKWSRIKSPFWQLKCRVMLPHSSHARTHHYFTKLSIWHVIRTQILRNYISPIIFLFSIDEICPICRTVCLDNFEKHVVHCRELLGFKYRHGFVWDILFDIFRRAGVFVKNEAPVNFLTDPHRKDGRLLDRRMLWCMGG
jgi:hypothetical protein